MPGRVLAVACALAVVAAVGAAPERASADVVRDCADVSVGYTAASLSVRNTSCPTGRRVVRRWLRRQTDGPPPSVSYVDAWRCTFWGRYTITLRCTSGARAVRAVWGD